MTVRVLVYIQRTLYGRVHRCVSPQRHGKTQQASDRSDGVGQTERSLRQRRLRQGGAASVPASLHVHRLQSRRLARQAALRTATSRFIYTSEHRRCSEPCYAWRRGKRRSSGDGRIATKPI